jgi:hypothetical protein
MEIKISTDEKDIFELYTILYDHQKFAKSKLNHTSFETFFNRFNSSTVPFLCFNNNSLVSALVSLNVEEMPVWFMKTVITKKGTSYRFDAKKNGISLLFDEALKYWESQRVSSMLYIQPEIYMNSANDSVLYNSPYLLENYKGYTLAEFFPNENIKYSLIKKLAGVDSFNKKMVARIHSKIREE